MDFIDKHRIEVSNCQAFEMKQPDSILDSDFCESIVEMTPVDVKVDSKNHVSNDSSYSFNSRFGRRLSHLGQD